MIDNKYIDKFYKEVCDSLEGEYKIVLEPGREFDRTWIEVDSVKWEIEDMIKPLVDELKDNNSITLEEKILEVYKFICLNYIYDVNVLYFFRKDRTDPNNVKYIACDWYGRIIGNDWIQNRKKHNRRICYEFARTYAKVINELIDNKYELEAVIVGDVDNTHYVVGLTGKDYSLLLDQDDFNSIKDLTRLKLNLTIEGIYILRDNDSKFINVVNLYNSDKLKELSEIEKLSKLFKENKIDIIEYLQKDLEVLKQYNLDSQGYFEYMRALTEKTGVEVEKVWRLDNRNTSNERRHERCFYFEYMGKIYLFDSVDVLFKEISLNDMDMDLYIFNPEKYEYKYFGN